MFSIQRAKTIFFSLPVLVQWTAISFAKAIAASALMSFLSIYATALFATRHGFRVPVEGVPFLTFAIGLGTFVSFVGTLILFSVLMLLFMYIQRYLDFVFDELPTTFRIPIFRLLPKKFNTHLKSYHTKTLRQARAFVTTFLRSKFILIISAAVLGFAIAILLDAQIGTSLIDFQKLIALHIGGAQPMQRPWEMALEAGMVSIFLVAVWCVAMRLSWIAAQVAASAMILTLMASALFANDVYGSFLRVVRYGGGIEATIRHSEGGNKSIIQTTGNLLILTTTQAVIFDAQKNEIIEIALKNAFTIKYAVQPRWRLPNYELKYQKEYFDLEVSKVGASQN